MFDKKCTILVNSCDKYEEAWMPFFTLFHKHWPNCRYEKVLNTETKQFNNKDFDVRTVNSTKKSWGDRMFDVLQEVDTSYVICMLEDFFLQKDVDFEEIERCINAMDENPDIAVFYFSKISGYKTPSQKFQKYFEMHPEENNSQYMFNCQAALWRKDALENSVKNNKTPWEYEDEGFLKADEKLKKMEYYCSKESYYDAIRDSDVFSYLLVRGLGYGIFESKWLWNNKKLFKKENIACKCNTLPKLRKSKYLYDRYKSIVKRRLHLK